MSFISFNILIIALFEKLPFCLAVVAMYFSARMLASRAFLGRVATRPRSICRILGVNLRFAYFVICIR